MPFGGEVVFAVYVVSSVCSLPCVAARRCHHFLGYAYEETYMETMDFIIQVIIAFRFSILRRYPHSNKLN